MSDTKVCGQCKQEKPLDQFSKRNTKKCGYQSTCKSCQHEYYKKRYNDKQDLYKKHRTNGKKRRGMWAKLKLVDYLKGKACVDCGETDPIVLTFDHIKALGDKSFDISTAVSSGSYAWETIEKEIAKCEIRCCNCHQRKTAIERGYYKLTDND